MGKKRSSKKSSFFAGFLWVAVLFGLILLALPRDQETKTSKKVEAYEACMDLATAIRAFRKDTGQFPLASPNGNSAKDHTMRSVASLLDHLSGSDDSINREKTAYFTVKQTTSSRGAPGQDSSTEDWKFVDPWGEAYHIRMDTNGDGFTEDPRSPGLRKFINVLVWSSGPDKKAGTWEDNLLSW